MQLHGWANLYNSWDLYYILLKTTLYQIHYRINYVGLKLIGPGGAKSHRVSNTLLSQKIK